MQDKVFIEDLEVETIIGIFGWERKVKQIVKISLEMDFCISDAAKTDNIDQALDYKSIGKDISSFKARDVFSYGLIVEGLIYVICFCSITDTEIHF